MISCAYLPDYGTSYFLKDCRTAKNLSGFQREPCEAIDDQHQCFIGACCDNRNLYETDSSLTNTDVEMPNNANFPMYLPDYHLFS